MINQPALTPVPVHMINKVAGDIFQLESGVFYDRHMADQKLYQTGDNHSFNTLSPSVVC